MNEAGLVVNRGSARRPDYWLLSTDEFSDEELAEVEGAMRRCKVSRVPLDAPVRWHRLYSKKEVLGVLRLRLPKGRRGKKNGGAAV